MNLIKKEKIALFIIKNYILFVPVETKQTNMAGKSTIICTIRETTRRWGWRPQCVGTVEITK